MANHSRKFFHFKFFPRRRRKDLRMLGFFPFRWAGVLVVLLMILGLAGMAPGVYGDELQTGKDLYDAKCMLCHGANGRGDGPAAAAFTPKPANFTSPSFWKDKTPEKIASIITKGEGHMPAFNFKPDEIKAVIDYLEHTFKK